MNNCELILGQKAFFNRTVFQACAAKTVTLRETRIVIQDMKQRFKNCVWAGISYRLPMLEDFYEEIESTGKKMLLLMKKLDASNLTIGVSIWYCGNIANHDCCRMVLNRTIEMIETVNSIMPPEKIAEIVEITPVLDDLDPVNSHTFLEFAFPSKPESAPQPPFDYKVASLRKRLSDITEIIDGKEAKSLHELTAHSLIGKVLHVVYCLLEKPSCTSKKLKNFFKDHSIIERLKEFEPTDLNKRKIKNVKKLLQQYSYLKTEDIEKISHSSVLLLEYVNKVLELITEVPQPSPVFKENLETQSDNEDPSEVPRKQLIYRPGKKISPKNGLYLHSKNMVIDEKHGIFPIKFDLKINNESEINLSLRNLQRGGHSYSVERSSKAKKIRYHGKSQISANKLSQISSFSLALSKKTLETSRNTLVKDEEIIDRILNINPQRIDSFSALDLASIDKDTIRSISSQAMNNQPTQLLVRLAEYLKERREAHSLI